MIKYKDDEKENKKCKETKKDNTKKKDKCTIKYIEKLAEKYEDLECTKDRLFEASEIQLESAAEHFEYMMEVLKLEDKTGKKINLWFKECACKYPTDCKCEKVSKKFLSIKAEEEEIFEEILKAFCELMCLFEKAEKIDEIKDELLKKMEDKCIPEKKCDKK